MPRRPSNSSSHPTLDLFLGDERFADLDDWAHARGFSPFAGVDEVGRGPLAGPVVAAAVVLDPDHPIEGLADSKALTARRRERLAAAILAQALAVGLAEVGPARIDELNIRRASLEAMRCALAAVLECGVRPQAVLVDGLDVPPQPAGAEGIRMFAFVGGDARSSSIGAASIVAKVHRDRLMCDYHARWPEYGFDRHKGYPTAAHRRVLERCGPCPIHRRSFKGVKLV